MKNIVKYQGSASKLARQRGTTLIELSVVIAVILLLVGVLFIGVTAWKEGANRAACIVNLSSIQKAVRGYQNMNEKNVGDACVAATALIGPTGFFPLALPACPSTGVAYTPLAVIPAVGTAYATCVGVGHAPTAANLANW